MITETVESKNLSEIKASYHIPARLRSCHTATVGGYIVEGHVPLREILRLLKERPEIIGLSVPGMPVGSPGMEMANHAAEAFQVIAFDHQGRAWVFATYPSDR